ncbi:MAG: CocE/NonD family hydrolase, partial [Actinomycetota bacterium]
MRPARFFSPFSFRIGLGAALLLGAVVCGCAARAASLTPKVAMSDGVQLATDVYLPAKGKAPYSTILIRTPYDKNGMKALAGNLNAQGYAVVIQDMRGRFASEGHHAIIFGNDGLGGKHQDGHDTLRWLTKQEWSNGKVATWGGSALGIVQNMAAPGAPESLKGQVVIMAFSDYYHQAAYPGGVWRKELLEGWLKGTKMEDVNLSTFLEHSTYDDFWKGLSAEAHAEKVDAPGIFVGGWYDIFLQGTLNSFTTIQSRGGPNARGKCFLVVGPQAHGAFDQKIDYPNAAQAPIHLMVPMNLLSQWLNGSPADAKRLQPVHYYVMGAIGEPNAPGNRWRSTDAWPPPAKMRRYFLGADHTLTGRVSAQDEKLAFKYDPANPVPTTGGQNLQIAKGPMDQRPIESRPDVLVFSTEPLTQPLEVTGRITARLNISSDCPDTDFTVKLTVVYPDGRSMLVADGIQRASLRKSFAKRELLKPGEVYELAVDLWSTSL